MSSFTAPGPARALPKPGSLRAWVMACRPATLTAAAAPVLVGTAVAARVQPIAIAPFWATLAAASLLQIASNFANDVFDFEKGADTEDRLGPPRAVQARLVTAVSMKRALVAVLATALLLGVYLASVAGWVIVAIGIAAILAAVGYTGGPYPLGYHGLGDLFVLIFFGFVAVCGTCYVQLGFVPGSAWWCGLGLGATATNILVVNNVRDRETDARAGKRTLAVRWGRRGAEAEYIALYAVAYLVPVVLLLAGWASYPVLLGWITIPRAARNVAELRRLDGRPLNAVLVKSARLVFVYGLSLALGLLLSEIVETSSDAAHAPRVAVVGPAGHAWNC